MSVDVDAFLARCTGPQRRRLQRELRKHPGARAELQAELEKLAAQSDSHAGDLVVPDQHKLPGRCPGCGGKPYSPKLTGAVPELTQGGRATVVQVLCSHPFHTRKP